MNGISDIFVAVLAGGLGTRLRQALKGVPKAMASINGKPFLHYLFDWLVSQGTKQVVLCTGYLGEQIKDYFGDHFGPVSIAYSHEAQSLGTAGALRHCLSEIHSDIILVVNGDTYCDANLKNFLTWHKCHAFNASVLLSYKKDVHRFGSVETDQKGQIVQFHEKASRAGGGYVSAGIYLLNRSILEKIPDGKNISMEYEVLPKLIGNGLSGYKTKSAFIDIGTPESFGTAQTYFEPYAIEGTQDSIPVEKTERLNQRHQTVNMTTGDLS
jgi:D-glycero-alpha-D-manno-heptose 1-phosphate guanylyltransferase